MDNFKIESILKKHPKASKNFLGVYCSTNIPFSDIYPFSFIVNTDKCGNPGEHWVACFVPNPDTIEYFDSYGELPNSDISKYLLTFNKILFNCFKIQSIFSDVCGNYCIYFVIQRSSKISFEKILSKLKKLSNPDLFVKNFLQFN